MDSFPSREQVQGRLSHARIAVLSGLTEVGSGQSSLTLRNQ
jgi:hypothetical protein